MNGIREECCNLHGEGDHWNYSLQQCSVCIAALRDWHALRRKWYKFYDVTTEQDLIKAQIAHLERLEAKLPPSTCEPCNSYRK